MKKVIALVLSLVLVLSLAVTPAFAEENVLYSSTYADAYVLVEDERIEINPFTFTSDKVVKFYLIISEEAGIFLQYGDFISRVDDYIYLGGELYVSFQDIVEAFDSFETVYDSINHFLDTSRFEIGDTISE